MSKVKWGEAKICFNCGTSEDVACDLGTCRPCEDKLLAKKRIIMDRYYDDSRPHWKELRRIELDRDNALSALFNEFKIPDEFLK